MLLQRRIYILTILIIGTLRYRCGTGIQLQRFFRSFVLVIHHVAFFIHDIDQSVILKSRILEGPAVEFIVIDFHRCEIHPFTRLEILRHINDKHIVSQQSHRTQHSLDCIGIRIIDIVILFLCFIILQIDNRLLQQVAFPCLYFLAVHLDFHSFKGFRRLIDAIQTADKAELRSIVAYVYKRCFIDIDCNRVFLCASILCRNTDGYRVFSGLQALCACSIYHSLAVGSCCIHLDTGNIPVQIYGILCFRGGKFWTQSSL